VWALMYCEWRGKHLRMGAMIEEDSRVPRAAPACEGRGRW
jgi:hypothetical protein